MADVLCRQLPEQVTLEFEVDARVRPATQVERHHYQRLVHGDNRVTEAGDAAALAERLVSALPRTTQVLDEVVRVTLDVAGGIDLYVEQAVLRELLQHVVHHAYAGLHGVDAGAIQVQLKRDLRLPRLAIYAGSSIRHGYRLQSPPAPQ